MSYVSTFVEELSCFPKITHTNRVAPLSCSNLMLHLNEETLYDDNIQNSMLSLKILNTKPKRLVLKPYENEIHLPYMISSLKKAVSILWKIDFLLKNARVT